MKKFAVAIFNSFEGQNKLQLIENDDLVQACIEARVNLAPEKDKQMLKDWLSEHSNYEDLKNALIDTDEFIDALEIK